MKRKYCSSACNTKAYRLRHPDRIKESKKKYDQKHRDAITERNRDWRERNKEKMQEYRVARKEKNRIYWKERRAKDPLFRIKNNLRNRLNFLCKGGRSNSLLELLGCSHEEFKKHIESQFQPDMTWNNYGKNGWHLDHVKPLALFNLLIQSELEEVCHFTNLQPLWQEDNLKKWCKYEQ